LQNLYINEMSLSRDFETSLYTCDGSSAFGDLDDRRVGDLDMAWEDRGQVLGGQRRGEAVLGRQKIARFGRI
jgi:hypothetical protein